MYTNKECVGDVQRHRLQDAITGHCLFGHGPKVQHGIYCWSPLSESELGIRQIGAHLAEMPENLSNSLAALSINTMGQQAST